MMDMVLVVRACCCHVGCDVEPNGDACAHRARLAGDPNAAEI
jgi:hypothetical protein